MRRFLFACAAVTIWLSIFAPFKSDARLQDQRIVKPIDPLLTALHNRRKNTDAIVIEIRRIAKLYAADGVTQPLVLAMIEVESGFRTDAKGKAGEIGLMQIKPATAKPFLRDRGYTTLELRRTPGVNIEIGIAYLVSIHRELVSRGIERPGEYHASIIAYNTGLSRVLSREKVSLVHYRKVRSAMSRWQKTLGV